MNIIERINSMCGVEDKLSAYAEAQILLRRAHIQCIVENNREGSAWVSRVSARMTMRLAEELTELEGAFQL